MRIAMLGHKRIPSREGGVEIVVDELSTRLAQRGHSVTAYNRMGGHVSGKEYGTVKLKEYKGVRLKKALTIDKKGLAAMTSSLSAALCTVFGRYDVVHFHAEGPCAMTWLPKLFGKRVIATIHGLDWQRAKWGGFATRYLQFGEKMAVRYADEIIVLSKNVQQYFKDTYNRETVFIPNGVDKPEIKPPELITEKWRLQKDGYILFLGRIVPEKGILYLIEAFKKVKTDKKLVIAGGASDTSSFMNEVQELAKDDSRIMFTGFVQGQALEELYSSAYIYILPSDLEGMPISLLEAMSYGNCCLVSDIPECTEVVGDKAVTFKKSNIDDLSAKLQMLCDNEQSVQEYKKNASEYICGSFNWDDVTDRTLELYEK
ncbi:MAG: glycosyltransferase family 4 protein [Candidatus Ornithomonoglobus sp.]